MATSGDGCCVLGPGTQEVQPQTSQEPLQSRRAQGAEATRPPVPVEWQLVSVQEPAFLHFLLLQMPMTFSGSAKHGRRGVGCIPPSPASGQPPLVPHARPSPAPMISGTHPSAHGRSVCSSLMASVVLVPRKSLCKHLPQLVVFEPQDKRVGKGGYLPPSPNT